MVQGWHPIASIASIQFRKSTGRFDWIKVSAATDAISISRYYFHLSHFFSSLTKALIRLELKTLALTRLKLAIDWAK